MKGKIIAQEFNKMVWVQDNKGTEYSCSVDHTRNVKNKEELSTAEQKECVNLNSVLGDSW
jgi:hypothetical protein